MTRTKKIYEWPKMIRIIVTAMLIVSRIFAGWYTETRCMLMPHTYKHIYMNARMLANRAVKRLALKHSMLMGLQLFWRCFELFMYRKKMPLICRDLYQLLLNAAMVQICDFHFTELAWVVFLSVAQYTKEKKIYISKMTVKISRQFPLLNNINVSSHRLWFSFCIGRKLNVR